MPIRKIKEEKLELLDKILHGPVFVEYWRSRMTKVTGNSEEKKTEEKKAEEKKAEDKPLLDEAPKQETEKIQDAPTEETKETKETKESEKDTKRLVLLAKMNNSMAGRLESEIPLGDDYWKNLLEYREYVASKS